MLHSVLWSRGDAYCWLSRHVAPPPPTPAPRLLPSLVRMCCLVAIFPAVGHLALRYAVAGQPSDVSVACVAVPILLVRSRCGGMSSVVVEFQGRVEV
jgi:hypothetical protein